MNLYYELLQYPVFSMKEVNAFYSSERTARVALGKLLKENIVLKIRNGLYTCVSGENGGPVANRFQVASAITPSSYVSHHTAFEYYGTVDQIFYEVYVGSEMRFHDFEFDDDTESIITNERYVYISSIIGECVTKKKSGELTISDKIDRVVTNRFAALPIFAAVMFLVYFISVSTVGTWATDWANDGVFGDGWHLFGIGTSDYEDAAADYGLTVRESDVAKLAAKRYSNKEIAEHLFIAESTVKSNMKVIFNKLQINSRAELKNFFE